MYFGMDKHAKHKTAHHAVVITGRPHRATGHTKNDQQHSYPLRRRSRVQWSEGVLYKRLSPLCLTHCWDQREGEREREMEQITAVGKGTTFFLLLVLAASASATSLNNTQQNTVITATSDKQVRRVWGVCA